MLATEDDALSAHICTDKDLFRHFSMLQIYSLCKLNTEGIYTMGFEQICYVQSIKKRFGVRACCIEVLFLWAWYKAISTIQPQR